MVVYITDICNSFWDIFYDENKFYEQKKTSIQVYI